MKFTIHTILLLVIFHKLQNILKPVNLTFCGLTSLSRGSALTAGDDDQLVVSYRRIADRK